jgi:erythromycin esterase
MRREHIIVRKLQVKSMARSLKRLFPFKVILLVVGSMLNVFVKAQQPLNLDFEKSSIDPTRPWGWDYNSNGTGMEARLDSNIKLAGKFSLFMKINQTKNIAGTHFFYSSFEPYQISNKALQLEGWVRSEVLIGKAFVVLNYSWNSGDSIQSQSDTIGLDLSVTQQWKHFSFLRKMPSQLRGVNLSLCHTGTGSIWFDDLALKISGEKINELQVSKQFSKGQMEWLSNASSLVHTVDATMHGEPQAYNDLKAFKDIAGDARIIALGEATHGTSEFFRMKHRVLEYAVREMGVRVFAIEDHQMIVERVNDFVLNGKGEAEKSMSGMFSIWGTQEVINMIKWVRAYNIDHPNDKVEFLGFDMQAANEPLDSLFSFLQKKGHELYATATDLLSGLRKENTRMYLVNDSTKQVWADNAQKFLAIIGTKKTEWLSVAKTEKDSTAIEWAIQYARLVQQFARESINPMALYRDVAMADNISWILSRRKPDTKMLIWAHDVHISRGEHPNAEYNYHGGISMGSWLAKKYGTSYKAFGISTYVGEYRAYPSYTNYAAFISCPAFPGPIGSLDEALHQISVKKKSPALLLNLRNTRQLDWLTAPLPVRFANHVCFGYAYWTRFSIPYQFDGIIFIDKTTSAKK